MTADNMVLTNPNSHYQLARGELAGLGNYRAQKEEPKANRGKTDVERETLN